MSPRRDGFRPAQQTMDYVEGEGDALELRRNRGWKRGIGRMTFTVSVDTADAGAVAHPDAGMRVLDRLLHQMGDRVLHELTGQDYRHITPRMVANPLTYNDGGFDPTTLGNYSFVVDFVVPSTPSWAARGSYDARIPGVGVNETFQLQPRWNRDTPAGGGDAGTQALLAADPNNLVEMTWVEEPSVELTEEYDDRGDPLPLYLPMTTVHQSSLFDVAQDDLLVQIDTNKPIMALLIQVYQRAASGQQPADLVDEVDFFGMDDYKNIPWEHLQAREQADFPGVDTPTTGVVGVLAARGGKHSARWGPGDYQERAIRLDIGTAPPNGQGRVRVILWHPVRKNVGTEVREKRNPGQGRS